MNSKDKTRYLTPAEHDEALNRVVHYHFEGKTHREIAKLIGRGESTVTRLLYEAREAWKADTMSTINEFVNRQLAEIAYMKRQVWEQWHRSKEKNITTITNSQNKLPKSLDEDGEMPNAINVTSEMLKEVEQCGDPRYMALVGNLLEQERKLFELLKPATSINNTIVYLPEKQRINLQSIQIVEDVKDDNG